MNIHLRKFSNYIFKVVFFAKIIVTTVTRAQRSVPSWALVCQWAAVYEALAIDGIVPTDGEVCTVCRFGQIFKCTRFVSTSIKMDKNNCFIILYF